MGLNKLTGSSLKSYSSYVLFGLLCFLPFIPSTIVYNLEDKFSRVMSVASYLTWHNMFEFTSVLVSLSVFMVSYYTYEQTGNIRSIYLGSIFLTIGLLDAFHTLSYKGMPEFFIQNTGANRATTLWILSRMIASVGFLFVSFTPLKKSWNIHRRLFLVIPACLSISILVVVTYFPEVLPKMYEEGVGLTSYKKNLELVIMVLFFGGIVKLIYEYFKTRERLALLFSFSLVLSIYSELAFVQYTSVYDVYNYLGHIYKFLAFFVVFRVILINNIRKPYLELYDAKQEIKNYADNLDIIVQTRTEELRRLNTQLLEDLDYARDIQKAMCPSRLPKEKSAIFNVKYLPAERVSGDFYNIFRLDEDNIALYIGDVSGHGVPAAMLTVFVNQTIRTMIDAESTILCPSRVLHNVYELFNKTNFKEEVYIVMLYAVYNMKRKELTYSSAGLNVEPLLIRASGEVEEIKLNGFPICKFIEYYSGQYKDITIALGSKDKILFYTDGLTEAQNVYRDFYSKDRLMDLLKNNYDKSSKSLNGLILKNLFEFTEGYVLKDDITYFIMEINE